VVRVDAMITVRVEVEELKEQDFYGFINRIHSTFARRIFDAAKKYTPRGTGEMEESWEIHRESVHRSEIYNTAPHARYLLGTGVWGPTGRPFCSKTIQPVTDALAPTKLKPMVFPWRFKNNEIQVRQCVQGINPRFVHGAPGVTYDFIGDMDRAVREGVDKARQEMNE
jgi:Bacteriophage HK97-gp10, putative tail-component